MSAGRGLQQERCRVMPSRWKSIRPGSPCRGLQLSVAPLKQKDHRERSVSLALPQGEISCVQSHPSGEKRAFIQCLPYSSRRLHCVVSCMQGWLQGSQR